MSDGHRIPELGTRIGWALLTVYWTVTLPLRTGWLDRFGDWTPGPLPRRPEWVDRVAWNMIREGYW